MEKKKVLIVDDEKDICELLGFQLKREGFDVFSAYSGKDALDLIEKTPVDLVISDVRMPGGDGLFLLDGLRKTGNETPLVFLSGFADIDDDEAKKRGALGLVSKPIDKARLNHFIEVAVGKNKS